MLLKITRNFGVSNSILKAAQSYKNSATQRKMHQFDQSQQQIRKVKSKIDYQTIDKQSQGYIMIREFLFQESKTIYQANYQKSYLVPSGKWTVKQIQKMLEQQQSEKQTPAQNENKVILKTFQNDLQQKLIKYYNNIGKKDYTFSVTEQIQKIEQMTPNQFQAFMDKIKDQN